MREIKFRAWTGNKMEDYGFGIHPKTGKAHQIHYSDDDLWQEELDYSVMQYTGLKDKNGVEIYEGDIVKDYGVSTNNFFEIKDIRFMGDFLNYGGYYEVIGNVYENLELLDKG